MSATGTVVLNPGHGGSVNLGGSDANHAVSPSGVLEKNMTLDLMRVYYLLGKNAEGDA